MALLTGDKMLIDESYARFMEGFLMSELNQFSTSDQCSAAVKSELESSMKSITIEALEDKKREFETEKETIDRVIKSLGVVIEIFKDA